MAPKETTRDRILDAAERSFAEHGFDSTSLRSITAEAGVNLAAVNYHFGSKEALVREIFARRLSPLNAERMETLDRIENAAPDGAPGVEEIVEAFVGPALRMFRDPARGGKLLMRLAGQAMSQANDQVREIFVSQFREVVDRFGSALRRALPDLSHEDVFWRMLFMVGAMVHSAALSESAALMSGGRCRPGDADDMLRRIVPFVAAGLRAPASSNSEVPTRGAS